MRRLAQSTAYTVVFPVFLSSDHVTAATGKTVAITLSKAGGGFGNPNAGASNATEISGGWYKFALDTTDTGSLGDLVILGTATLCDIAMDRAQVVSATSGGYTNLDVASSTLATAANLSTLQTSATAIKGKTDSLTFTIAGQADANIQYVNDVQVNGVGSAGNPWGP